MNLQPKVPHPELSYSEGSKVLVADPSLGENAKRVFVASKNISPGQAPNLSTDAWNHAFSNDYEIGKQLFSSLQCVQCHAVNRTGIGAKGPNLTLFGLRTSLAAGWMRNDPESLSAWLKNSNEVKFGNLMWNGEGIDDDHPVRNLENDDVKVNQLVAYLLEQI